MISLLLLALAAAPFSSSSPLAEMTRAAAPFRSDGSMASSPFGRAPFYSSASRVAFSFSAPAAGDYATLTATTGQTITCARASTATVQTSPSAVASVASGHCAVDYRGLQVEGASTNLFLQSADQSNVAWSVAGGGASAAPTVTGNTCVAPDGTTTSAKVVIAAVASGANRSIVFQNVSLTAGSTYTMTLWVKSFSGIASTLYLNENQNAGITGTCAVPSSGWARCAFTFLVGSTASTTLQFGVDGNYSGGFAPQGAQTVCMWGTQVEALPLATSYIPTTGTSATRAADVVTFTKPTAVSVTGGTYSATVTAQLEGTSPSTAFAQQGALGSDSNFAPYIRASWVANTIDASSNSAGPNLSLATTDSQKLSSAKYALVSTAGTGKVCFNGSCGTPVSNGAQPGEPGTIYLGSQPTASPGLDGWISAACLASSATGCPP